MISLKLKIPPPIVALAMGLLMWLIARVTPSLTIAIPARWVAVALIAALGATVAISGVLAFRKAKTTVNPMNPSAASALVNHGIYRRTRNPMYLGLLCVLLAWMVWLSNPLALLGPIAFVLYMNQFQIGPEESALDRLFGQKYAEYRYRVRRWI